MGAPLLPTAGAADNTIDDIDSPHEQDLYVSHRHPPLPLGLVLGEDESIPGMTSVDEVAAEGNGAAAG
eukprot:scaffold1768_cov75-Skeletonema_dohrnii-CCMP3373.AAC.1